MDTKQIKSDSQEEYTEDELETFGGVPNEASYFEKAQDFRPIIKSLRIRYLGLKQDTKEVGNGIIINYYTRDPKLKTGINKKGIEDTIRFLEPRLTKHSVLSNITEDNYYDIILDDMRTWFRVMLYNFYDYELDVKTLAELRILVNDLLEFAYRRAVGNMERSGFKPESLESLRRAGVGLNIPAGPSLIDDMKKEAGF
jgi:hypothetical protein